MNYEITKLYNPKSRISIGPKHYRKRWCHYHTVLRNEVIKWPGYNYGNEVASWLNQSINDIEPVCQGYEQHQIAFVYFDNWSQLAIQPNKTTNKVGFIFHKVGEEWNLKIIVFIPNWAWPKADT